jgi:hypothetical protein
MTPREPARPGPPEEAPPGTELPEAWRPGAPAPDRPGERPGGAAERPGRGWYSSGPLEAEGGIRARSRRGAIGEQWWSRRFIDVLESFGLAGRLQRGRRYARTGQVLDLQIAAGYVSAMVQGSRVAPYKVRIQVLPLTTRQWHSVEQALAARALFRARLLAGEMPAQIEEVFAACGTPLFPRSAHDLQMRCSCPDWGVPCKHLAAVCYVLAERFDDDPFQVLAWRGRGRDALLAALRRPGSAGPGLGGPDRAGSRAWAGLPGPGTPSDHAPPSGQAELTAQVILLGLAAQGGPAAQLINEPLTAALDRPAETFWAPGLSVARLRAEDSGPAVPPDLLLRILEPPPVSIRGPGLATALTPAYLQLAFGPADDGADSTAPDSTAPDSTAPDSTALGSTAPGSAAPGSQAPDSAALDSAAPGGAAAGSPAPDSAGLDSAGSGGAAAPEPGR